MFDVLLVEVDRLAGKMDFVQKNLNPKTVNLWGTPDNFRFNGSNELYPRSVASKLRLQQAEEIFHQQDKNRENLNLLLFGRYSKMFNVFFPGSVHN